MNYVTDIYMYMNYDMGSCQCTQYFDFYFQFGECLFSFFPFAVVIHNAYPKHTGLHISLLKIS